MTDRSVGLKVPDCQLHALAGHYLPGKDKLSTRPKAALSIRAIDGGGVSLAIRQGIFLIVNKLRGTALNYG